ncbi:MAG: hypothetical protein ACLQBX_17605 [Candidatus Limnocylindrales bacterium]
MHVQIWSASHPAIAGVQGYGFARLLCARPVHVEEEQADRCGVVLVYPDVFATL